MSTELEVVIDQQDAANDKGIPEAPDAGESSEALARKTLNLAREMAELLSTARVRSQHIEEGRAHVDKVRSELEAGLAELKRVLSEVVTAHSRSSELRAQIEADATTVGERKSQSEVPAALIATLAEKATKAEEEVARRFAEMLQKLSAFDQQFETQKGRIDALITEQQGQFSTRLSSYESQVSEQRGRLETLHNDQQIQFTQRSDERTTKFTEQLARFEQSEVARTKQSADHADVMRNEFSILSKQSKESADKLIVDEQERFGGFLSENRRQAEASLNALQARLDEAVRIVGLIGNTGLTGNYQRVANHESKVANQLRWTAILCMVAMVASVFWIVAHVTQAQFDWQVALFRLAAAIVCLAPGLYCAKESARHRRVAERNRRIELELASLSPYLAELPDVERRRIVGELSHQYFGGEKDEKNSDTVNGAKGLRADDLVKLLDQINKLRK